jgi:3-oxoacyl-[acyl-carrier-protein] synthase III
MKAAITGVEAFFPDYILNNETLSKLVDTTDEWIMQRIGIKERRILKGKNKGTSDMAAEAVKKLLKKKNINPDEIGLLVCATVTSDMKFPSTANIVSEKAGIKNAFSYDLSAACSGFIYALINGAKFIEAGDMKKVIVVGADKMSSIVDYTDRATCPIFGDAAAAVLLEPTEDENAIIDYSFKVDGEGIKYLHLKAGGSLKPATYETIDAHEHYLYQEGQSVFKFAISKMPEIALEVMAKNGLTPETLDWLVPHQANIRIIEATAKRMGLSKDKVMINIEKYGNTTAATIPLCLWEWENKVKKGQDIILTAFGGGFTWGAVYLKWAY